MPKRPPDIIMNTTNNAKTFKYLLMNNSPKFVSIVQLDPQVLLTIGTHIIKKRRIHYDVR